MTEEENKQVLAGELEDVKDKSKQKGKTDENCGPPDILSQPAMTNAYLICHNVQDLMYYRGFFWEGAPKGKGKKKKR